MAYFFLKKYPGMEDQIYFEMFRQHGHSEAKCKEFRCKKEFEDGDLRIMVKQKFGNFATCGFYPKLGSYHYNCFIKTLEYKTNTLTVADDNFSTREVLEKEELAQIEEDLPQLDIKKLTRKSKEEELQDILKRDPNTWLLKEAIDVKIHMDKIQYEKNRENLTEEQKQFDKDWFAKKIFLEEKDLVANTGKQCWECSYEVYETKVYPKLVKTDSFQTTIVGLEPFGAHHPLLKGVDKVYYCKKCNEFMFPCTKCGSMLLDWVYDVWEDIYACSQCSKVFCQGCCPNNDGKFENFLGPYDSKICDPCFQHNQNQNNNNDNNNQDEEEIEQIAKKQKTD